MSRNNSHDMKVAKLRRQAREQRSCPSCGSAPGPAPGSQDPARQLRCLVHEKTCALTAVSGERGTDGAWFDAHPGERRFTRRITPAEQVEQYLGYPGDPVPGPLTVVQVTSLGPSLRARCFVDPVPAGSPN